MENPNKYKGFTRNAPETTDVKSTQLPWGGAGSWRSSLFSLTKPGRVPTWVNHPKFMYALGKLLDSFYESSIAPSLENYLKIIFKNPTLMVMFSGLIKPLRYLVFKYDIQ